MTEPISSRKFYYSPFIRPALDMRQVVVVPPVKNQWGGVDDRISAEIICSEKPRTVIVHPGRLEKSSTYEDMKPFDYRLEARRECNGQYTDMRRAFILQNADCLPNLVLLNDLYIIPMYQMRQSMQGGVVSKRGRFILTEESAEKIKNCDLIILTDDYFYSGNTTLEMIATCRYLSDKPIALYVSNLSAPEQLVLTKESYESYFARRFSAKDQAAIDLITKEVEALLRPRGLSLATITPMEFKLYMQQLTQQEGGLEALKKSIESFNRHKYGYPAKINERQLSAVAGAEITLEELSATHRQGVPTTRNS